MAKGRHVAVKKRRPGQRSATKIKQRQKYTKPHRAPAMLADHWDPKKTVRENYRRLGLSENTNQSGKKSGSKNNVVDIGLDQVQDGSKKTWMSEGKLQFVQEMMETFGEDYAAMARSKLNLLQHTPAQIRRMCERAATLAAEAEHDKRAQRAAKRMAQRHQQGSDDDGDDDAGMDQSD